MRLSPAAQLIIAIGQAEATGLKSDHLDPEHLVIGALKAADLSTRLDGISENDWASAQGEIRALAAYWKRELVNPVQMRRRLRYLVSEASGGNEYSGEMSSRCRGALNRASALAGDAEVGLAMLLSACLDEDCDLTEKVLTEFAVDRSALAPDPQRLEEEDEETTDEYRESPLAKFGRDLTMLARAEKLTPVIGRREEMKDLARILSQSMRNNAMLVGDAGVGKTAVVEGLAQYAASDDAHPSVRSFHFVEITMVALIAGAQGSADVASRLMAVLEAAKNDPNLVLFIDEFHTMAAAGDILKPALARGEIHCIGATTVEEYQKHIERNEALARRFQRVWIAEPSLDETVEILKGLRPKLEEHHGLEIPDETIEAAVDLVSRFVPSGRRPDKAIILLDQACAQARILTFTPGASPRPASLQVDAVAEVIAKRTQLPVGRILMSDTGRLAELEKTLGERVIGQPQAVRVLARALQLIDTGLEEEGHPFVVLFAGPSGTGKTELAKALSAAMFGNDDRLIALDMTRFRQSHHREELIGSPVGYVGSDETPKWVTEIERQPDSVVLLDEIEKAHPDVLTVLMPVFDEGRLETARGKVADFSRAIFVLTSNLGTGHTKAPVGFPVDDGLSGEKRIEGESRKLENEVRQAISRSLLPEILGRIREIVVFQPLTREALDDILELHLGKLNRRRGLTDRHTQVDLDDSAKDFLIDRGYSTEQGARHLIRALDRWVVGPLASAINAGEIGEGERVVCRRNGDELEFDVHRDVGPVTLTLPPDDMRPHAQMSSQAPRDEEVTE